MCWDYNTAVRYIYDIPKFTKKGGPEQTRQLMAMLGHPQNDFRYIHIAGTNGKGSVSALMAQALQSCGIKTGLFTSPHLMRINERLRIDGVMIADEEFVRLFISIKQRVDAYVAGGGVHPTFFEWMYMMAMCWFSAHHVQYAVVETGLGGRLDATNVIRKPELTLITSIGIDHVQYLGGDIASIAGEKAGIIKKNVPLVFDASVTEASDVISRRFKTVQAGTPQTYDKRMRAFETVRDGGPKLYAALVPVTAGMAKHVRFGDNRIDYDTIVDCQHLHIALAMNGTYQVDNSLLALQGMALIGQKHHYFHLGKTVFYQRLAEAFKNTVWAGRMEKVRSGFYVDGAHNDAGIQALVQTLHVHFRHEKLYLLFAVAEDKDYARMIAALCALPNLEGVVVTVIDHVRGADADTVAALFEKIGHAPVKRSYNIKEALQIAMDWADGNVLCGCGSLYLAGSIKELLA